MCAWWSKSVVDDPNVFGALGVRRQDIRSVFRRLWLSFTDRPLSVDTSALFLSVAFLKFGPFISDWLSDVARFWG